MPGTRGTYRRVLLKLSGEVFGGEKGIGVDPDVVQDIAKQIASILKICTNEIPIIDIKSTGVVHNNTVISPELLREVKRYSSGEQN